MNSGNPKKDAIAGTFGLEQEASDTFVRRLQGQWSALDQTILEHRLQTDFAYADAYRRVEDSWSALDTHAEAPELMNFRAEALNFARRTHAGRWLKQSPDSRARWRLAASIVLGAVAVAAAAWQFAPFGMKPGEYRTDIGEQRIVELDDQSRIALDAATRLRVRYSDDTRLIELQQGQAQFSVAKDVNRPFKVKAGAQTIVALGTVFTVEYVGDNIHVAMMEGRVAIVLQETAPARSTAPSRTARTVSSTRSGPTANRVSEQASDTRHVPATARSAIPAGPIELSAGEEIRIKPGGQMTVIAKADLEAATAWREGKVIIRTESLSEAVRRLNRYSRMQIQITDPQLAARHVSGVFEAGDTQGFLNAVQRIYTVNADHSDPDVIRLSLAP